MFRGAPPRGDSSPDADEVAYAPLCASCDPLLRLGGVAGEAGGVDRRRVASASELPDAEAGAGPSEHRVEELRSELSRCRENAKEKLEKSAVLEQWWGDKRHELQTQVEEIEKEIDGLQGELDMITRPTEVPHTYPGPVFLKFAENKVSHGCSAAVALAVLFHLIMELVHFHETLDPMPFPYSIFFFVELLIKVALHQGEYLCGPSAVWNIFDLAIVATCFSTNLSHNLSLGLLARLLPTVKCFRYIREWDVAWSEGYKFQTFMMGVIVFNSFIIALEDYYPHMRCWGYANSAMLAIFTFELVLKLKAVGWCFFYRDVIWNWLDFVIVIGGLLDQSQPLLDEYLDSVETSQSDRRKGRALSQFMMILRLARLLRILRLVKLVKRVKPLYTLVIGIAEAMHGMGWVVILTIVWLYMGALVFVKLVGHGLVFNGRTPQEIQSMFPNVPAAMWVLFKVMNGDPGDLEVLFQEKPYFKLVVAIFMIISSWAILSILTAVVSENMITATEKLIAAEREEEDARHKMCTKSKLEQWFLVGDKDEDGKMTEREFRDLLSDDFKGDELRSTARIDDNEIEELFYVLSTSEVVEKGEKVACIDKEDFIEGLMSQAEGVTTRALFRLEKRLTTIVRSEARNCEARLIDMMAQIGGRFTELTVNLDDRVSANKSSIEEAIEMMGENATKIEEIGKQVECMMSLTSEANSQRRSLTKSISNVESLLLGTPHMVAAEGPQHSLQESFSRLERLVSDRMSPMPSRRSSVVALNDACPLIPEELLMPPRSVVDAACGTSPTWAAQPAVARNATSLTEYLTPPSSESGGEDGRVRSPGLGAEDVAAEFRLDHKRGTPSTIVADSPLSAIDAAATPASERMLDHKRGTSSTIVADSPLSAIDAAATPAWERMAGGSSTAGGSHDASAPTSLAEGTLPRPRFGMCADDARPSGEAGPRQSGSKDIADEAG